MVKQLEKVQYNGTEYFLDDRLREMRDVNNPHNKIEYADIEVCSHCSKFLNVKEVVKTEWDTGDETGEDRSCPTCGETTVTLESAQGC